VASPPPFTSILSATPRFRRIPRRDRVASGSSRCGRMRRHQPSVATDQLGEPASAIMPSPTIAQSSRPCRAQVYPEPRRNAAPQLRDAYTGTAYRRDESGFHADGGLGRHGGFAGRQVAVAQLVPISLTSIAAIALDRLRWSSSNACSNRCWTNRSPRDLYRTCVSRRAASTWNLGMRRLRKTIIGSPITMLNNSPAIDLLGRASTGSYSATIADPEDPYGANYDVRLGRRHYASGAHVTAGVLNWRAPNWRQGLFCAHAGCDNRTIGTLAPLRDKAGFSASGMLVAADDVPGRGRNRLHLMGVAQKPTRRLQNPGHAPGKRPRLDQIVRESTISGYPPPNPFLQCCPREFYATTAFAGQPEFGGFIGTTCASPQDFDLDHREPTRSREQSQAFQWVRYQLPAGTTTAECAEWTTRSGDGSVGSTSAVPSGEVPYVRRTFEMKHTPSDRT